MRTRHRAPPVVIDSGYFSILTMGMMNAIPLRNLTNPSLASPAYANNAFRFPMVKPPRVLESGAHRLIQGDTIGEALRLGRGQAETGLLRLLLSYEQLLIACRAQLVLPLDRAQRTL